MVYASVSVNEWIVTRTEAHSYRHHNYFDVEKSMKDVALLCYYCFVKLII